jgi:hypothetical protein
VAWGGGFFAFANPATSGLCIVDHYAGNGVVIQITSGSTISSVFQAVGTIAQYSLGAAAPNVLRRIDVTNAAGDAFQVGANPSRGSLASCRQGTRQCSISCRWHRPAYRA